MARYLGWLFTIFFQVRWYFIKRGKRPIAVVLSPGKVGSSSIYELLKDSITAEVFHLHYISARGVDVAWRSHLQSARKSLPAHLRVSRVVSSFLRDPIRVVKFVVLLREPISREISAVFQNLDQFEGAESSDLKVNVDKVRQICCEKISGDYLGELDEWLNREIEDPLHVSIDDIIMSEGSYVAKSGNKSVLFLRVEDLEKVGLTALSDFFDYDFGVEALPKKNIGVRKYYAEAYRIVKDEITRQVPAPPTSKSKYLQIFYPEMSSGSECRSKGSE